MDIEKLRDSIIVLENEINRIFEENTLLKTKMGEFIEDSWAAAKRPLAPFGGAEGELDQSLEKLNNLLENMLLSLPDDNMETN